MLRNGHLGEVGLTSVESRRGYCGLEYFGFSAARREFQAAERTISSGVAWIEIVMLASRARSNV